MPPKGDPVEDMIKALSDKRVKELLCGIFEDQLKTALSEIHELKRQNQEQTPHSTHHAAHLRLFAGAFGTGKRILALRGPWCMGRMRHSASSPSPANKRHLIYSYLLINY